LANPWQREALIATILRAIGPTLWFVGGIAGMWLAGELGLTIGIIAGGFFGYWIWKDYPKPKS
jgi:hypothetical protein